MFFMSVRAGDIMNGHDSVLLDASPWRGEGPGDHCYEFARFDELENIYFIGHIPLPTDLLIHVIGSVT